ncbi:phage tail protein, partial [Streptococcus suis]
RNDDNMTYSALSTKAYGGEPIKTYFSGDTAFDKKNMLKETLGGYAAPASVVTGH